MSDPEGSRFNGFTRSVAEGAGEEMEEPVPLSFRADAVSAFSSPLVFETPDLGFSNRPQNMLGEYCDQNTPYVWYPSNSHRRRSLAPLRRQRLSSSDRHFAPMSARCQ